MFPGFSGIIRPINAGLGPLARRRGSRLAPTRQEYVKIIRSDEDLIPGFLRELFYSFPRPRGGGHSISRVTSCRIQKSSRGNSATVSRQ